MADIWNEKPKPVWVPRGYSSTFWIKEDDVQMIILDDLDAWLEKLKAEFDRLNKEGLEHHAIAVEYYEKFVAVKKGITHIKDTYQDMPLGLERMIDELLKILEGAGK